MSERFNIIFKVTPDPLHRPADVGLVCCSIEPGARK